MTSKIPSPINLAASHITPQLSVWERLHGYIMIPVVVFKCTVGLIADAVCMRVTSLKSFKRCLGKQVAWTNKLLSLRQNRARQLPTGEIIARQCEVNKWSHQTVHLDVDGFTPATLHFIDCEPQDKGDVVLYLHGGGYIYPADLAHVLFARMAAEASSSHLAMLEYTLTPESKYPSQLAQGLAAVRYLLHHYKPSEIIIGGDSGGGNLTLGILAHLREPHPQIPPIEEINLDNKLKGAFCISPRCSNVATKPSFRTNAIVDTVSAEFVKVITLYWQPVLEHVWATPVRGDRQFWSDILARKIILVAGANECYVDDIRDFAALISAERNVVADRVFCVCSDESHDQCIFDLRLGIRDGMMTTTLMDWFQNL